MENRSGVRGSTGAGQSRVIETDLYCGKRRVGHWGKLEQNIG